MGQSVPKFQLVVVGNSTEGYMKEAFSWAKNGEGYSGQREQHRQRHRGLKG